MDIVNLNIKEAKSVVEYFINNNLYLESINKKPLALNLQGPAGIGKTSLIKQIAKELDMHIVCLNLAQFDELGELTGFPVKQYQLCKEGTPSAGVPIYETKVITKQVLENGKMVIKELSETVQVGITASASIAEDSCLWIDEVAVNEYIKQGYIFTGNKRMAIAAPEFIAGIEKPILFFMDDFSRAQTRFLQATMQLIQDYAYASWKLPKGSTILLSTNPDSGTYAVESFDDAMKSRFMTINIKQDVPSWGEWAEKDILDTRLINFLLLNPELADNKDESINLRSFTNFFNSISSMPDFSAQLPLIQMLGEGSIGSEATVMFTMFINNKLDKLITPTKILFDNNEAQVMRELSDCIGTGNNYRADIASILVTRIINVAINFAEHNSIEQKTIDRLITLTTTPNTLTNDLKYILIKKIINGNKQKFARLLTNADVVKIAVK